jgi:hypothetical protein
MNAEIQPTCLVYFVPAVHTNLVLEVEVLMGQDVAFDAG